MLQNLSPKRVSGSEFTDYSALHRFSHRSIHAQKLQARSKGLMSGPQAAALAAALFDAAAALAHFACIAWGARGLRLLGAGERMARMAEAGHWYPPLVSAAIGAVLSLLSLYALAGAGILAPLPFMRPVLAAAGLLLLARAVAFPWLKRRFPDNSERFWHVSSAICLAMGLLHLAGLAGVAG